MIRVFRGRDEATGRQLFENKVITGSKDDAKKWAYETERDLDMVGKSARLVTPMVSSLLKDLVEDYHINGKSLYWCKLVVRVHLEPFFGTMRTGKVETTTLRKYIVQRQEAGAKNATINRELSLLRRAFHIAFQSDPPRVSRVPKIPKLEENNARKGFFEDDQYRAIMLALPEFLRPVLAFGYYTGCRRGEILSLQWSQVDLIEGMVRLEPGTTKNNEARAIPLDPELLEQLRFQRAARDAQHPACPWVFFGETGDRIRSFRGSWLAACKVAGYAEADRPTVLFHDLRRTGVRNLVRAGVPEKVAQSISGHKTRAVFERYNIVTDTDLKDAVRRQHEYLKAKRAMVAVQPESESCTIVAPAMETPSVGRA